MGIFDLFSKRQKRLRGDMPDVYSYDTIPQPLRVQVVHIWQDTIGNGSEYHDSYLRAYRAYKFIVETLCREYGVFKLTGPKEYGDRNYLSELANFVLHEQETEKVLDAIEISFRVINRMTRVYDYLHRERASELADEALAELNGRFQEHAVGFQFVDGEIIRIDSELIHAEVVKPALALLHQKEYAGAQAEFLKAHEHYRHGNTKEALTECLKALESVMKAICAKRKWQHPPNATSSALIQCCFDNGLVPTFWTQQFSALRSTLESGVPTARNRLGGHGQGSSIVSVPPHLVAYVLHMTASAIVFLAESERSLP
jgi:AbiJ N-terminal domain 4